MRKSILIDWKSVEQKILDINSNIKNPNEFLTLKKSGNVVNAYLKANGEYLFQTNALDFPCFNYRDEFVGKLDIKNQELEVFTYADLHIHTEYSILDGANRISDLSKKFGYYGAITDHGVMYGCVDFDKKMNALHKHSIKGFEMYTESWKYYQALNEGNLSEDEMQALKNENKNVKFHLIGLAMNETGYKNLVKLCSYGQSNVGGSFPKRPRVSYEELVKHKEGIIILSACIGGEIPQRIIKNDLDTAQAMIKFFKNEFGENFYLEIQKHASESKLETLLEDLQFKTGVKVSLSEVSNDYYSYKNGLIKRNDFVSKYNNKILKETELIISEEIVNEALVDLSNAFDVKLVVTTDAHYLNPEDAYAHEALLCNQTGKTMNDPSHMFFSGDGYYVHTTDEIENKFREYPEAIINTIEVAEKCNFNFEFGNYKLPNFPIPDGYTDVEYLKKLVYDGFKERFGHLSQAEQNEYRLRLEFELNVIFKMGYQGYFFIVWDYIRYAKENNIYVGPGRGSGAGSIVLYCLRITENLDPIQYGLLFERFLNPDRVSMPK